MRVMILLAHGSRKKESALEIETMAAELEVQAIEKGQFNVVKPAFMQFCGPNFYQVVDKLIENGELAWTGQPVQNIGGDKSISASRELQQSIKREVLIVPYFISAGSHVSEDIPELIANARAKYPDISFTVTQHIGKFQGLTRLILEETAHK